MVQRDSPLRSEIPGLDQAPDQPAAAEEQTQDRAEPDDAGDPTRGAQTGSPSRNASLANRPGAHATEPGVLSRSPERQAGGRHRGSLNGRRFRRDLGTRADGGPDGG